MNDLKPRWMRIIDQAGNIATIGVCIIMIFLAGMTAGQIIHGKEWRETARQQAIYDMNHHLAEHGYSIQFNDNKHDLILVKKAIGGK